MSATVDREKLAAAAAQQGLTGSQLARRARLGHGIVNHLLAGRRTTCSDQTAARLEDALNRRRGALFTYTPTHQRSA